jgi:hypothetical protein
MIRRLNADGDFIEKSKAGKELIPAISRLLPEENQGHSEWDRTREGIHGLGTGGNFWAAANSVRQASRPFLSFASISVNSIPRPRLVFSPTEFTMRPVAEN